MNLGTLGGMNVEAKIIGSSVWFVTPAPTAACVAALAKYGPVPSDLLAQAVARGQRKIARLDRIELTTGGGRQEFSGFGCLSAWLVDGVTSARVTLSFLRDDGSLCPVVGIGKRLEEALEGAYPGNKWSCI